ncbi:MAG: septal ring lytic transglycosylase RlpA family protein [Candidatus Acidiferrales bacterium]
MKRLTLAGLLGLLLVALGFWPPGENEPAPVAAAEQQVEPLAGLPMLPTSDVIVGKASWYGLGFHGRLTASGIPYNRFALTAAHRTLPSGTVVRVTNLRNARSAVLVINDWGPVPADREIDVSEAAAEVLGFREQGVARVRIEVYRAAYSPL